MGKIRIKTIGDETAEQSEKEEAAVKREQRDLREGKKKTHVAGMKGGERTTTVGVSEEDILAQLETKPAGDAQKHTPEDKTEGKDKKTKGKKERKILSKRHKENKALVNKAPQNVSLAIEFLRKFKKSAFDETVELHINTREKGVSGTVSLPHGTGKALRVKVADDGLISQIESGKIDFDVLVATPAMMPKLAKVAKILGPRGLMPNPKNGTITDKPEETVNKLTHGQIGFKTEAGAPIIHLSVGKLSFEDKKLSENISTVLSAIGANKISSVTLKSTMSPAIRVNI